MVRRYWTQVTVWSRMQNNYNTAAMTDKLLILLRCLSLLPSLAERNLKPSERIGSPLSTHTKVLILWKSEAISCEPSRTLRLSTSAHGHKHSPIFVGT